MEKYEPLGVVGEGSYGVVLKCRHRESGRTVAIKKFIDSEDDQNVRKIALREIRVLRKLRHENLVNLLEVFRRRKHLYLVFEFIDHTLLDEMDNKSHGLDEETARKYIFQILRGLGFCHDNNIIHRDVKPENVLVSKSGIVKLCDFGFARNLCAPGELYTDYVATRWYRAPELLVGDVAYGKEVDIWAVGCLFAEMMSGEPLFPGDSDIDQLFLIAQCLGRLAKRHLNIMSRNSAFRGFQFPKSRNGSTASMDSLKTSKVGKLDSSGGNGGRSKGTIPSAGNNRYSGNSNNKSQKRLTSVEKSVFSGMFPSWTDEAIHFLTICLDPEPSARPSCNGLLRLPYFTNDNFPSRFMAELNTKLQLEGRHPIPSYSTRKKRSAQAAQPTSTTIVHHQTHAGANVTSSLSPANYRNPGVGGLHSRNPLYQTRTNLNILTVSDDNSNKPIQFNSLTHNIQNDTHSEQQQKQQLQIQPKFSMSRDQTFLVDRNPNRVLNRRTSFGMDTSTNATNNESSSRIPTLLHQKYSDDFLIKNSTNHNFSSPSNNSNNNTSKSTPNIVEEANNSTSSSYANSNSNISNNSKVGTERRFSISQNPNQQLPAQINRKFSYSFPENTNPPGGEDNNKQEKVFHHLPVTTLTFSMGPHTLTYKNGLGHGGGVTNGFGYPKSPNSSMTNNNSSTLLLNQKRSPSPPKTKTFSTHSSSYFPQTQHFSTNTEKNSTTQPGFFHHKSLPVSIFGSSMLKNNNSSSNSNGESFLPRMAQNNNNNHKISSVRIFNNEDNSITSFNNMGSPSKPLIAGPLQRKGDLKWDQQNQSQQGRKLSDTSNGNKHFSTFTTNNQD